MMELDTLMNVIREHKGLVILLALSLLVIVVGLWLVHSANHKAQQQLQQEQASAQRLGLIAQQAESELHKTLVHADVPIEDIVPLESLEKVKGMAGQEPEPGSEAWCEWMMVKDADSWTTEEQSLFAQRCI